VTTLSRRKSRELALQMLYQVEMSGYKPDEAQELYMNNFNPPDELRAFADKLVRGTCEHRKEIDKLIGTTATNWSLNRITPVDRCILRVAVFEIIHCSEIPYKVTLNEAIELGKKFGTEKSGAFINGVLDNVLAQNPELDKKKR
jgi:transcription antitermination protein NusB